MSELPATDPALPPAAFQRLRELFARLAELPAGEQEAEVARCAGDHPALAAELRALLAQSARARSPLDSPVLRLPPESDPPLPRVPGFRLERRIGRGGSATVYLAHQEHRDFTRPVALKVVDRVVDAAALGRVREEQRILARLEHPGIARLYDSGVTPHGQPYLAMEFVQGETILDYCRSRQLEVRERLELFLGVLDAVAYAHGETVVHRDLKPANILVSARREAKLLDFGIARLVADPGDDDETRTLRRAMTPAYASPEQVRGDRVTAASDIYSLGVVLYELLAGTSPYRVDGKRFETLEDAIREQDPESPSHAFSRSATATTAPASAKDRLDLARQRRALRGDLDAIVLKALRKRPEARYASVGALAGDLRRFLAGEPVAARRGDRLYRAGKLLRRHRAVGATLGVAILAALALPRLVDLPRRGPASRAAEELAVFARAAPIDDATRRALREGADRLGRHDAAGSRDAFRRALASARGRQPATTLAWDGLARAESARGEVGRATEAATRAWDLLAASGAELPRHEADRLRARSLAAGRDWDAAVPALEELFARQPGRIDLGLDLVAALAAAGRSDEADNALGRLRQLGSGASGTGADPRIDLAEAEVALQLSELQRAAAAAARVRQRAGELGAVALGLRAERLHAEAISRLDRQDEARRDLASLADRANAAGLARESAAARLALGTVLARSASNEEARRELEAALAGLTAAADERGQVAARIQLALQAAKRGEVGAGLQMVDAALAEARRIGDRWSEGYALSQLLVLANWADDEAVVEEQAAPTLAALRDSGNRQVLMATLGNLAILAIERLEIEQAEAYLVEAEGLARRVGSQLASAAIDRSRGYLEQTRGDLDLARERYAAAIDKARRADVPLAMATYLADLAWLELAADRPDAAATHAQEAIASFNRAGDTRSAAANEAVLAWADARRGDAAAAERRLVELRRAAAEDDSASAQFSLLGIEARVAEASGDWERAIELRHRTVRMATEWQAPGLVIVQQTGLARALHGAGDRAALERLVAEMLPEVERLGLRGIARDLRGLLASPAEARAGGDPPAQSR